jgi:hypothetical protein
MQINPELAVARACNDLIDAQPNLQDMLMVALVLEKIADKFSASDRTGLFAILVKLALTLDKDACSYATQH